jgi:chitin disaccharide deacetylase
MDDAAKTGFSGFVLCADDFALTAGVSRGILDLLAMGAISATGAMTNRPHWTVFARELADFSGKADLGVHVNLTCASPLGAMPLLAPGGMFPAIGEVARAALASEETRAEIAGEINRQLDAFEQAMGRAPDFVDGHQHVHVMPGIRAAVIAAIGKRYAAGKVYLRDPSDSPLSIARRKLSAGKAMTVSGLAMGLAHAAAAAGIPVNRGFSGFSPFDAARDFGADFARFCMYPGPAPLIMCHPGHVDAELADVDDVIATRPIEQAWLMKVAMEGRLGPQRFSSIDHAR